MNYVPIPYPAAGYFPGCSCGAGTCPPCGTTTPPPLRGPIMGVVDGSDARPGEVGEYMQGSSTIQFEAYPVVTQTVVSPLVLSAGDWDINAYMVFGTRIGPCVFTLTPVPPGMTFMQGGLSITGGSAAADVWPLLVSNAARGLFSVPTLLPFTVAIYQIGDNTLTAGTGILSVSARRRR